MIYLLWRFPLRALNAIYVRVFGADLLTVHVQLDTGKTGDSGATVAARPAPEPDRSPVPQVVHVGLAAR